MFRLSFIVVLAVCTLRKSSVWRSTAGLRFKTFLPVIALLELLEIIDDRRYHRSGKLNLLIHVVGLYNRDRVFFFDNLKNGHAPSVANGLDFLCHLLEIG